MAGRTVFRDCPPRVIWKQHARDLDAVSDLTPTVADCCPMSNVAVEERLLRMKGKEDEELAYVIFTLDPELSGSTVGSLAFWSQGGPHWFLGKAFPVEPGVQFQHPGAGWIPHPKGEGVLCPSGDQVLMKWGWFCIHVFAQ